MPSRIQTNASATSPPAPRSTEPFLGGGAFLRHSGVDPRVTLGGGGGGPERRTTPEMRPEPVGPGFPARAGASSFLLQARRSRRGKSEATDRIARVNHGRAVRGKRAVVTIRELADLREDALSLCEELARIELARARGLRAPSDA